MQDTKLFDSTLGYFTSSSQLTNLLISFLNVSHFSAVYQNIRSVYNRCDIIRLLVFSKYLESSSIRGLLGSDMSKVIECGKDVFYSVKNNDKINWRSLMWKHTKNCINQLDSIDMDTKVAHKTPCLIVDDTDIPKTGRCFEMVGKIFSHTGRNYKMGFKSLNLCYWTGKININLDYSLHVEKRKDGNQGLTKKELNQRYSKDRPIGSPSANRLTECLTKKTSSLIQMIKRALRKGIQAQYLLVDSWFFSESLVSFICSTPLHLLTRPKKNNWKYIHNNTSYTIGQLLNKYKNHKARKWSRKLNMFYISIPVEYKGNQMTLYFYKPKKRGSKWHILIGTQKSLQAIKAYELYQNRWSIEVTYKELKQHFNFGKCQSRNFTAQIADHTICLMAYNYLSIYKCINKHQSIGAIFQDVKQNWIRPTTMQLIWNTILKIAQSISKLFNINIDEVIHVAINNVQFLKQFDLNQLILTTET